jgi:hypothetical protein
MAKSIAIVADSGFGKSTSLAKIEQLVLLLTLKTNHFHLKVGRKTIYLLSLKQT